MLRYLKLLGLLIRISVANDAAYRFDFLMRVALALIHLGSELLIVWTIFSNTRSLAGWGMWQVIVLLGVFRVMSGLIGTCIAPNMRLIMQDIRDGTLDFVLTKPLSSQFYVSFRRFVVWRFTDVLIGLALAGTGAWKLSATLSAGHVAAFVLMLVAGAVVIYSFWLILATTVFWFTRISNIEMVFWNVFETGRYPVDIYRPIVRWTLTWLVPIAFVITIPAGALVGRTQLPALLAALLIAPLMLLAASLFWRYGLRRYSGASA